MHTTEDASSVAGEVLSERLVARLLPVFAAAAGCLDAFCVMRLGGPFASVITGNLVHLGRAIATLDRALAASATTAVAGYALGVAAGSAGLRRGGAGWRRRTTLIAAIELVLMACVAAGWLATDGQPDAGVTTLLLVVAAAAMGVQSALSISFGVRGASTTYLTGTLTSLVQTIAREPHQLTAIAGGAARLAALLCGAVVGALLLRLAPLWAPAVPVLLVGTVVGIAAASTLRRSEGR
jgi:uncharacterized membrane protein YoaK (UPF0700 family)